MSAHTWFANFMPPGTSLAPLAFFPSAAMKAFVFATLASTSFAERWKVSGAASTGCAAPRVPPRARTTMRTRARMSEPQGLADGQSTRQQFIGGIDRDLTSRAIRHFDTEDTEIAGRAIPVLLRDPGEDVRQDVVQAVARDVGE